MTMSHAGSWRAAAGCRGAMRRCARLSPALEGLDDRHASAQHGHGDGVVRLTGCFRHGRRDPEQLAGTLGTSLSGCASEQAVMADAVEAPGQHVKQEAADEPVDAERHHLLSLGTALRQSLWWKVTPVSPSGRSRSSRPAPVGLPLDEPGACRRALVPRTMPVAAVFWRRAAIGRSPRSPRSPRHARRAPRSGNARPPT